MSAPKYLSLKIKTCPDHARHIRINFSKFGLQLIIATAWRFIQMHTPKYHARILKSPALIFLTVALSVFVAEAMVMLLLSLLPQQAVVPEAITDAALLVALISPTLYFFSVSAACHPNARTPSGRGCAV
jgi:hypothetical protein